MHEKRYFEKIEIISFANSYWFATRWLLIGFPERYGAQIRIFPCRHQNSKEGNKLKRDGEACCRPRRMKGVRRGPPNVARHHGKREKKKIPKQRGSPRSYIILGACNRPFGDRSSKTWSYPINMMMMMIIIMNTSAFDWPSSEVWTLFTHFTN
jgi:hypothetical protein